MAIKRGVSLYSYQQSQFFKELMLDDQIREVASIPGADGIEIIDEMSLRYPDPGAAFVDHWFAMMEANGTVPVAMDVGMDVLQFRDHVMTIEENAERLRSDIRLAKRLGFSVVRVLSTTPLTVLEGALDVAEELDIRLGKEVHQPMRLEGPQVTEVLELAARRGTGHLGIVPDLGIFQYRPSEALLGSFERKGAQPAAGEAAIALSKVIRKGEAPRHFDVSTYTAGNIRSDFRRYLTKGDAPAEIEAAFRGIRDFTDERVKDAREVDYLVVAEALTFSNTSEDTLREISPHVVCVHGKFYEMSAIPGRDGQYQDISIDYEAAVRGLKAGGYDGYINSEYEGQRYYQDRTRAELMSEVEQVRRHQEMLGRLLAA
jgi:sugar phosphate isomerase/epimerase